MVYKLIITVTFLFVLMNSQCSKGTTVSSCSSFNNISLPLLNGKCCWNGSECKYYENLSLGKITTQSIICGTYVEECEKAIPSNIEDKEKWHSISVESPYKCCFIKYRYFSRCFPLNISSKKAFMKLEYHLRTFYGWVEGGKITIDCSSVYENYHLVFLLV